MHNEIKAVSYTDPNLDLNNMGEPVALLTIQEDEQAWDQRHHHIRWFTQSQEKMGRSVYIVHRTVPPTA